MCGFTGFSHLVRISPEQSKNILDCMLSKITHRGPDDFGMWVENDLIYLGHRRLSIVDLSSAGQQQMTSILGRYVIVFNGKIYNHLDILNNI